MLNNIAIEIQKKGIFSDQEIMQALSTEYICICTVVLASRDHGQPSGLLSLKRRIVSFSEYDVYEKEEIGKAWPSEGDFCGHLGPVLPWSGYICIQSILI